VYRGGMALQAYLKKWQYFSIDVYTDFCEQCIMNFREKAVTCYVIALFATFLKKIVGNLIALTDFR
jgi:hypothetical protein